MSLVTPLKVGKLQQALHVKAKEEPEFRFYQLYDKIYRWDVLVHAYRLCRANAGASGVDGLSFDEIEARGAKKWLEELAVDLRKKIYSADPVRRVWIPKANGKERPLGIPTVRDRVVQSAVVLVLEPIFEADLQPEQYAYRRNRSAQDAVRHVHRLVGNGYNEVVDADLSGYFDSIPHADLMRSVARRVSDRSLLSLIKQWLVAPVEEDDGSGGKRRTSLAKDEKRGVPQGAPISPLLANLYMRRFLLGWKALGYEQGLQAYIVNFADDFVICSRGNAAAAMRIMRQMIARLDLTVNEDKTCLRYLPEESFDFLGYTIGRCYSRRTGRAYIGTRPSKKSIQRTSARISALTARRMTLLEADEVVKQLNRLLLGWSNYFCLGPVSKAYRLVDVHSRHRLRQWLRAKHKIKGAQECALGVGATDEECAFEQVFDPCQPGETTGCAFETGFVRQGLKVGLELEQELGFNPIQTGFIAATDSHNSNPGDVEEWDFPGAVGAVTSSAVRRLEDNADTAPHKSRLRFHTSGGLAAVWAPENTREAIFDALARRETYATSGPRMAVRFYAGWGIDEAVANDFDAKPSLIAGGVPMGGVLRTNVTKQTSPGFFVWTTRDPLDAPLQRVQMIKGWLDMQGQTQEMVVDIACADGLSVDPEAGRCPDNGASVDLDTCDLSPGSGAAELKTVWYDPDYDPAQSAFYYVRVLMNPTCRWSSYDAIRLGREPDPRVPATIRERAWTSPIWLDAEG